MDRIKINEIDGFKIGHAQDMDAATGCTVIICKDGASAGVAVRGGAPGTRETDMLDPVNLVEKIHAVMLSGGSAFGLDAAAGIMEYLEENGTGFDVAVAKVPLVAGAVLFDLTCGSAKTRPDKKMGYQACINSGADYNDGNTGAGTGATVGKIFGMKNAMKGGLGTSCFRLGDLTVGAVVAVNCLGDVVDTETGAIIAGAHEVNPFRFLDSEKEILRRYRDGLNPFSGNTTIGCVITNGKFSKAQAKKIASISHNGYARSIRPSHTMFDGDTVFVMASCMVEADINIAGILAARAVEEAVINGVRSAKSMAGFISFSEAEAMRS